MGEAYWVAGVGNEVFLGAGVLSAVSFVMIYCLMKAIRPRCAWCLYALLATHRKTLRQTLFQHRMQEYSPTTMRMPLPTRELAPRGRVGVGDGAEPENCPICLSSLSFAVDTNCGHTFCARCILSYWEHDQWPRAARCPVCRNGVICAHYKWNDFEIFTVTGVPVAPSCCTIQLNQPRGLEHGPQLQSANVWPAKICQLHCYLGVWYFLPVSAAGAVSL